MRKFFLLMFIVILYSSAMAQRVHVGLFGGAAAYLGDLTDKIFPKKVTNGAVGVTINYEFTDRFMLRGGLTYAVVGGADRYSEKADLKLRNLSFETSILEFSAIGEYNLLNLDEVRYTPYLFAGLAMFKFDPYTYDAAGQKQMLKPLSTEGQDIAGYADRAPYGLTQFAIPFGGGVKFALGDNIRVGIEGGLRKLFTDYLDDVSKNYIDPADLLAARGSKAVELSFRSNEVGGSLVYPGKDQQRGSPKSKDYYYFTGIHLTYRLGTGSGGGGGGGGGN
ncbi:MAG: DUF6089 family protein, partial [Bacteroidota bacterium]|nr:DUF6089 family protein [Bacteroidota bacterium]